MGKNECEQKEGWKMMMRMMDFDDVYEYTILRHIFTRWKKRPDTHTKKKEQKNSAFLFFLSLSDVRHTYCSVTMFYHHIC